MKDLLIHMYVSGCNETNYSTVVSQIQLAPWHVDSLYVNSSHNMTLEQWEQSIAEVRIYYSAMMEEIIIHEEGYPLLTLLCDVGGALGLIIGASVVSVLEVFDFFIMGVVQ